MGGAKPSCFCGIWTFNGTMNVQQETTKCQQFILIKTLKKPLSDPYLLNISKVIVFLTLNKQFMQTAEPKGILTILSFLGNRRLYRKLTNQVPTIYKRTELAWNISSWICLYFFYKNLGIFLFLFFWLPFVFQDTSTIIDIGYMTTPKFLLVLRVMFWQIQLSYKSYELLKMYWQKTNKQTNKLFFFQAFRRMSCKQNVVVWIVSSLRFTFTWR